MHRIRIGVTLLAVIAVVGTVGAVGAGAHARPAAASKLQLSLEKSKFGSILVINGNRVVYYFTKGNSVSTCTGTCASVWPALESSDPVAGPGVNAKEIGTVTRGGKRQVTYDGHLLYLYADGKASYDIAYIGINQFGGIWEGVKANGKGVR